MCLLLVLIDYCVFESAKVYGLFLGHANYMELEIHVMFFLFFNVYLDFMLVRHGNYLA